MLAAAMVWLAVSSAANDAMSLDELLDRFGWDPEWASLGFVDRVYASLTR